MTKQKLPGEEWQQICGHCGSVRKYHACCVADREMRLRSRAERGRIRNTTNTQKRRAADPIGTRKKRLAQYYLNKDRELSNSLRWRAANRRKVRDAALRRLYGISIDRFEEILKSQHSRCATCPETRLHLLCVDHCHNTRAVRGILCRKCNSVLGFVSDDTDHLARLIEYVRRQ